MVRITVRHRRATHVRRVGRVAHVMAVQPTKYAAALRAHVRQIFQDTVVRIISVPKTNLHSVTGLAPKPVQATPHRHVQQMRTVHTTRHTRILAHSIMAAVAMPQLAHARCLRGRVKTAFTKTAIHAFLIQNPVHLHQSNQVLRHGMARHGVRALRPAVTADIIFLTGHVHHVQA